MILLAIFLIVVNGCHGKDPHAIRNTACITITTTPNNNIYGYYKITVQAPRVTVTCINDTTLEGSANVTCIDNIWVPDFPKCLLNCPPIPEPPIIFTKETVHYVKTTNKRREEGTKISLSCVSPGYVTDGPSEITCNSNRKWVPGVPKCKVKPTPPERQWMTILAIAGPCALVLVVCIIIFGKLLLNKRQQNLERKEAIELSEKSHTKSFYKIWTLGRKHKKLISAMDFVSLKTKAAKLFEIEDYKRAKLVLEEDGTEINNSTGMVLSHDKVFMLLPPKCEWKPVSSEEMDTLKLTYDVCSFDRTQRKLFLSSSIDDLLDQAQEAFQHEASVLCLEEDGTIIEDNISLNAVAGQLLMTIGDVDEWRPLSTYSGIRKLPQLKLNGKPNEKRCFKVWTENHKCKKVIFADDLVDLHIKAGRALSMTPPIEISVLDENVPIIDNDQLYHHRNDILVAKDSRDIYSTMTSSDYASNNERYFNEYSELPDVLHHAPPRTGYTNDTFF